MLIVMLFLSLTLLCCALTALNGGRDGRWAAFMALATVLIGRAVGSVDLHLATSPGFKIILDGALLIGFYVLMLHSRRYWTIWITGFQMNGVLAHAATWLAAGYTPAVYRGLESVWGIPIMLMMVLGATLDRRAGVDTR